MLWLLKEKFGEVIHMTILKQRKSFSTKIRVLGKFCKWKKYFDFVLSALQIW